MRAFVVTNLSISWMNADGCNERIARPHGPVSQWMMIG